MRKQVFLLFLIVIIAIPAHTKQRTDSETEQLFNKAKNTVINKSGDFKKIISHSRKKFKETDSIRKKRLYALWLINAGQYTKQVNNELPSKIENINSFVSNSAITMIVNGKSVSHYKYSGEELLPSGMRDKKQITIHFNQKNGKAVFSRLSFSRKAAYTTAEQTIIVVNQIAITIISFLWPYAAYLIIAIIIIQILLRWYKIPRGKRQILIPVLDNPSFIAGWTNGEVLLSTGALLLPIVFYLFYITFIALLPATLLNTVALLMSFSVLFIGPNLLRLPSYYPRPYGKYMSGDSTIESRITIKHIEDCYAIGYTADNKPLAYKLLGDINDNKQILVTFGVSILINEKRERLGYQVEWDELPAELQKLGTTSKL